MEVRRVRRLCQERTEEAIKKVFWLMSHADKESVQLAAALAVLKIAGVRMDGEVTITMNPPPTTPTPHKELVAELTQDAPPLN